MLKLVAKRECDSKFCEDKAIVIPYDKDKMGSSLKTFQLELKRSSFQYDLTGVFVTAHYFLLTNNNQERIQYGLSQECESWFPIVKNLQQGWTTARFIAW